jgi:hypothetical protein
VSQSQNTSQASKSANVRSYLTALEVNLIGKIEEQLLLLLDNN